MCIFVCQTQEYEQSVKARAVANQKYKRLLVNTEKNVPKDLETNSAFGTKRINWNSNFRRRLVESISDVTGDRPVAHTFRSQIDGPDRDGDDDGEGARSKEVEVCLCLMM